MNISPQSLLQALVAGIFFGIWPLCMNKSGLPASFATLAFALVGGFCVCVIALMTIDFPATRWDFPGVKWHLVICAGASSAIGVTVFNMAIASSTPQNVSIPFVIANIVQTIIPAVYGIILNDGRITGVRAWGFVFALASAVLLTVKEPPKKNEHREIAVLRTPTP